MNYIEFTEKIKEKVQMFMGAEYKVSVQKIEKINTKGLYGLVIWDQKQNMTPNIYLESFYEEYQDGKSMDVIANQIIDIYKTAKPKAPETFAHIHRFDEIKDKIYFRVVNFEKNRAILQKIPHIPVLDLALVFSVLVQRDKNGIGNVNISNELLADWNVDVEDIYKIARKNVSRLFPPMVKTMTDIMKDIMTKEMIQNGADEDIVQMLDLFLDDEDRGGNKEEVMYVASNTDGINGASWLFYENELKQFHQRIGGNIYILPSSTHEIILVPSKKELLKEDLKEMVKEVNDSQVPEEDVLSYNIYHYDKETERIAIL